jgi:hypothetical protein
MLIYVAIFVMLMRVESGAVIPDPTRLATTHLVGARHAMTALTVLENVRTIQLTQGGNTLVDEADYPSLVGAGLKWCSIKVKKCRVTYVQGSIRLPGGRDRFVRMHRYLEHSAPVTDHRNHDGLDNRRANLRPCTIADNQRNCRAFQDRKGRPLTSKYKGVSFMTRARKWQAMVGAGPNRYLGSFATEIEAALAYDIAARERFGEFAYTNEDIFGRYWL